MELPPIQGVIAAMLTPRLPDGEPDLAAFEQNVAFVLAHGVAGVCVGGATGEYPALSGDERRRLLERARSAAAGGALLVAGAGAASFRDAVALADHAAGCGADAVLVPPPHFFPYAPEDVEAFYREAARAIRLPILIYHLPAFTTGVALDLALRLIEEVPNIVGVKDSSGSLDTLAALTQKLPGRALRVAGNDAVLGAARSAGYCDAVISGVAGVLPEVVIEVFSGERERATARLAEFIHQIDAFPTPWGLKLAAECRGLFPAMFALPLSERRRAQARAFKEWFAEWWRRTAAELASPRQPLTVK
jgi:4-hydroxy-tetrahydrodipicolinate synthase